MNTIENSIQVNTLFLTWQSNLDRHERYLVGAIKRLDSDFEFSYLKETQDYEDAVKLGFVGYPAFPLAKDKFTNNVMGTFMKRLPPRSRGDFKKYLVNHFLPENFDGNDFDLIAHTGIQLPSDGFDLIPDISEAKIPFDYLMEVAGTRYYLNHEKVSDIKIGSHVDLKCEDENEFDCNAIAMMIDNQVIGYVNKLFCLTIRKLMKRRYSCNVVKKTGTEERPIISVIFSVY